MPGEREVHLDVRAEIRDGHEPFQRIMATVAALGPGDVLVLRAPFEPLPLYRVLARQGFDHRAERRGPEDWWVWFRRTAPAAGGPAPGGAIPPAGAAPLRLDVRGLEPPEPMVRVLQALDGLGSGQRLEVLHDRRPIFLYPQLDARGFVHETEEVEPGLVRIVIRHGGSVG
jgi:uncharacterized protein (DUF2249 family)